MTTTPACHWCGVGIDVRPRGPLLCTVCHESRGLVCDDCRQQLAGPCDGCRTPDDYDDERHDCRYAGEPGAGCFAFCEECA